MRDFALALIRLGHTVVVQPVARKDSYEGDEDLIIEPLPWTGGDRELASMPITNPLYWLVYLRFVLAGRKSTREVCERYGVERIFCFWIVPSGVFVRLQVGRKVFHLIVGLWARIFGKFAKSQSSEAG